LHRKDERVRFILTPKFHASLTASIPENLHNYSGRRDAKNIVFWWPGIRTLIYKIRPPELVYWNLPIK
jgi:hypothetical protein